MPKRRLPSLRATLALIIAMGLTACDAAPRGPLADLAAEWTGGTAIPVCRDAGPHGEPLGPVPGSEYCEWMATDSLTRGIVSGRRFQRRLASVTWAPVVNDSADVTRVLATLNASMARRGLVGRSCENRALVAGGVHGTRWETAMLAVQLSVLTLPTGEMRLIVVAVDVPSVMTQMICEKVKG